VYGFLITTLQSLDPITPERTQLLLDAFAQAANLTQEFKPLVTLNFTKIPARNFSTVAFGNATDAGNATVVRPGTIGGNGTHRHLLQLTPAPTPTPAHIEQHMMPLKEYQVIISMPRDPDNSARIEATAFRQGLACCRKALGQSRRRRSPASHARTTRGSSCLA
jgi:hypothetical protein